MMGELSFKFSEEDCIRMVLEFLENRDLNIAQLSLERETGVTNGNFSDDLLFLRQLILDGQWDHVFEFISPLESITSFDKRQVRYILNKYKYIELLCIKFEIGHYQNAENCVKKIVDCLNELEIYCPSKEDYNSYCLLLTLENFNQHSDFKNWNPSKSRIKCFNELLKYVEKYLPIIKKSNSKLNSKCSKDDRLMQIIIRGLLYESCLEYCQNRAINHTAQSTLDKKINFEFSNLLDETKLNRSDSSLLSWLQAIPAETFNFQFEDKKLNVNIEKLDKPSLIATWSEMMLTSPIKPKDKFPHSATPFTRVKATDLMSKSLTSGIVDGLSKSIMNFSFKDVVDMSHSSIATTEFHLSNSGKQIEDSNSKLENNVLENNLVKKDNNDEKIVERLFEQGNVFNSSVFGKLSTIDEDKAALDLCKDTSTDLANNLSVYSTPIAPNVNTNSTFNQQVEGTASAINEMKMQLEQFADAQWKIFLRKKDELLMSSVTKSTVNDLKQSPNLNNSNNMDLLNKNIDNYMTPVNQTGQSNFKDLQSLITSTPKATPKDNQQFEVNLINADYKPARLLNFSDISVDNSTNNHTMTSNTLNQNNQSSVNETSTVGSLNDFHNHTAKLASNSFNMNASSRKNSLTSQSNMDKAKHPGSNNSSLKSQNVSLDSGVVAKSSSSVHLNSNQTNKTDSVQSSQTLNQTNVNANRNKGLFVELTKLEDVQAIRAVEFHPKGRYYAIGSNSKTLRICTYPYSNELKKDTNLELPIQPEVSLRKLKYHKGSIFCLGWNPSGELLATGSNDQTIKLVRFNQETCELVEETEITLQMHEATVRDLCFMQDSTNNSNLLISGGAGNCKIYLTDCQTGTPFQAFSGHSGHILSLCNWGGCVFVSGSQDRTIRLWDLRAQNCVNLITAPSVTGQGVGGAVSSVTVDPSGRLLVSGHDDASCMLYDIRGQRVIQTFKPHNGDIRSVRFSPKAYYLLSGGYDNNVVLTDLQGDLTQPLTSLVVAQHQDKVLQTKWHLNEFNFLTSSADKTAVLWSLPSN